MHGEQQSWHDWDPGKYETKRQPKGQIVDRLQNLSVKDKQTRTTIENNNKQENQ